MTRQRDPSNFFFIFIFFNFVSTPPPQKKGPTFSDRLLKDFESSFLTWIPCLLFISSVDEEHILEQEESRILVFSDGRISWSRPTNMEFACKMSLTAFPFDRQNCTLRYGSWSYDDSRVVLRTPKDGKNAAFDVTSEFHKNGEWKIGSIDVIHKLVEYTSGSWTEVFFSLVIERKPSFFVNMLLIPYFVISCLSSLVFIVQPESGEKISLAITTLLALVVFNEYVENIVPPSADNFPLLGK